MPAANGGAGTTGQVLTSQGAGNTPTWSSPGATTGVLYNVTTAQNTATPVTDYLFDVAYKADAADANNAAGAVISSASGTSGNSNATGLTISATANGTGVATALNIPSGSVLFSGTTGATPASGAGMRFEWIPSLGAMRAGQAAGSEWNAANIGFYSVAFGLDAKASGVNALALGTSATATGANAARH